MELPFRGSADVLELDFEHGVYVDGAGVVLHSLPLLSLSSDYKAIAISGCEPLRHHAIHAKDNANPAIPLFLEELGSILKTTSMDMYWSDKA